MPLSELPDSGSPNFESTVRSTLHTWKDSIEDKAAYSHTHGTGGGVSYSLVSREADLGTGAVSGQLSATTMEYNNLYIWDGQGAKWKPFNGNIYSNVSMPLHGTYQNVTGQLAYDMTLGLMKEWSGSTWMAASGTTLISNVTNITMTVDMFGGMYYDNNGAASEMTYQLVAKSAGLGVGFIVTDAQYLQVKAGAADRIWFAGASTALGGFIRTNTVNNNVFLKATADDWVITKITGAWKTDE